MSAADVERIADVVVEFVPGDRELAERIAGAVWEHLSIPPLMVMPGIDQDPEQFAEAMRKWRPVLTVPERDDDAIRAEAYTDAADEVHREARWQQEQTLRRIPMDRAGAVERFLMVERILRDRADALRDAESHGGDSVPGRAASAGDRRTGGLRGTSGLDGDGTSEGEGRG